MVNALLSLPATCEVPCMLMGYYGMTGKKLFKFVAFTLLLKKFKRLNWIVRSGALSSTTLWISKIVVTMTRDEWLQPYEEIVVVLSWEEGRCGIQKSLPCNGCLALLACRCSRNGMQESESVVPSQICWSSSLRRDNCTPQTGQSDFEHTIHVHQSFLFLLAGEDAILPPHYGCLLKTQTLSTTCKRTKKLASVSSTVELKIPPNWNLVGYGHLQQAGASGNVFYALGYHTCVILESGWSEGFDCTRSFAHGTSLGGYGELFETDEGVCFDVVSDESRNDGTKSSCDSDQGYCALGATHVILENE